MKANFLMVVPLKIYGKGSNKYNYFKYHLHSHLTKYGLDIPVKEVNDLDDIIASGVEAIPAIKIKNFPMMACTPQQNINDFLKESMEKIMQVYKSEQMKKILFPTDFSDASKRAFEYAKKIAHKVNATLTVVNYYRPNMDMTPAMHQNEIAKKIDRFVSTDVMDRESLFEAVHLNREYILGFAGEEIVNRSNEFDLIIMPTSRGLHGSKKWFGSVSKEVVENSECPVILLPPGDEFEGARNVLYPLKEEMKGFDSIEWFLDEMSPTLHVVHFDTNDQHSPMIQEMLGQHSNLLSSDNDWNVIYENQKCQRDQLLTCISNYINEKEIDLLILEKGKEHLFEFLLHKSISEKMLDRVDIPVIVLHEELYESTQNQRMKSEKA